MFVAWSRKNVWTNLYDLKVAYTFDFISWKMPMKPQAASLQ